MRTVILLVALTMTLACGGATETPRGRKPLAPVAAAPTKATSAPPAAAATAAFRDVINDSGITFRHVYIDAESGSGYKPNHYDHGSGLVVFDYDGDGRPDVYFLNQLGQNALYRNTGGGKFEDVTAQAGVSMGDRICVAASAADYDNDGDQDLFVTSYRGGNVLFRNDGGKLQDVTKSAGVSYSGHSSAATFLDVDNDGFLDLFVGNIGKFTTDRLSKDGRYYVGQAFGFDFARVPGESDILYRNNHDGTFTDVSASAGIHDTAWSADVAPADYDDDGDCDIYVTNMFGENILWRNDGGKFTDVAKDVLHKTPYGAMGARWLDADGDGRLDLYVLDMHSDMWMDPHLDLAKIEWQKRYDTNLGPNLETVGDLSRKSALELRDRPLVFGNALYLQTAPGAFAERDLENGTETFWPWGAAAADFDLDGDMDLFVPAGMGHPFRYWPHSLLVNDGQAHFSDKASTLGLEPAIGKYDETITFKDFGPLARSDRAAATADFDDDGDIDIITANFNSTPSYFRNEMPARPYIAFELRGTKSNKDAIGSRVEVTCKGKTEVQWLLPGQGYLTQSSRILTFALPGGGPAEKVRIRWPSGAVQELASLEAGKRHTLVEPS